MSYKPDAGTEAKDAIRGKQEIPSGCERLEVVRTRGVYHMDSRLSSLHV